MHANQACVPNNGPCVLLRVVGGTEVTRRPPLINVNEKFQKDTKSSKKQGGGGERKEARGRQTDGKGSTIVAEWHVFKPIFIQEVQGGQGRYSDTKDKSRADAFSQKDEDLEKN